MALFASISQKKHDFTTITEKNVTMLMNKLNNWPRKYVGCKTPNQVYFDLNPSAALAI